LEGAESLLESFLEVSLIHTKWILQLG
jgi:hypothetical protein